MKEIFANMDGKLKKAIKISIIVMASIILLIIGIQVYHLIFGTMIPYPKLENVIENSAKNYFAKDDRLPKNEGETKKVDVSTLISEKYMRTLDKYTKDTGCNADVSVTNNGGQFMYFTNLKCNDYKTTLLSNKIIATLVDDGDGLYMNNNDYYYKGEYVKNYIKLGEKVYRILGIDSLGNIKLIDMDMGTIGISWDDRFNSERNQQGLGLNDFEKSRIKEHLTSYYDGLDVNLKKYILNYDWCVGKRNSSNVEINTVECDTTSKMFIGTFIPNELVRSSMDPQCDNILSESCQNYNYLTDKIGVYPLWTLTASGDNSYNVYSYYSGSIRSDMFPVNLNRVLHSFYISGNNVYLSGDGSEDNPYVIK